MCKFKSSIAVKDASEAIGFRLLWSPFTESHEDLVRIFRLKDTRDNLARVEFFPPDLSTADQVETYALAIDEARTPEWLTNEGKDEIARRLKNYIATIIIEGEVDLLVGGQFILAPGARVKTAGEGCVINAMLGDAQIGAMRGNSQIGAMLDTSKIDTIWGNSQISDMRGNSKVGDIWGNSQIVEIRDNSQIGSMLGNSKVCEMWGNSQVGTIRDNSQIGAMWGLQRGRALLCAEM